MRKSQFLDQSLKKRERIADGYIKQTANRDIKRINWHLTFFAIRLPSVCYPFAKFLRSLEGEDYSKDNFDKIGLSMANGETWPNSTAWNDLNTIKTNPLVLVWKSQYLKTSIKYSSTKVINVLRVEIWCFMMTNKCN